MDAMAGNGKRKKAKRCVIMGEENGGAQLYFTLFWGYLVPRYEGEEEGGNRGFRLGITCPAHVFK